MCVYRFLGILKGQHHRAVLVVDRANAGELVVIRHVFAEDLFVVALGKTRWQISHEESNIRSMWILFVLHVEAHQLHLTNGILAQTLHNIPRMLISGQNALSNASIQQYLGTSKVKWGG